MSNSFHMYKLFFLHLTNQATSIKKKILKIILLKVSQLDSEFFYLNLSNYVFVYCTNISQLNSWLHLTFTVVHRK